MEVLMQGFTILSEQSKKAEGFLIDLGLDQKLVVPSAIFIRNTKTGEAGYYFMKKYATPNSNVTDSWLATMVDRNGDTPIQIGKIGKKIAVSLVGAPEDFLFDPKAKIPLIKSISIKLIGEHQYLGNLSVAGNVSELYMLKAEPPKIFPLSFLYEKVIKPSQERNIPICAPLREQMTK